MINPYSPVYLEQQTDNTFKSNQMDAERANAGVETEYENVTHNADIQVPATPDLYKNMSAA
jgi:hypothetical protein